MTASLVSAASSVVAESTEKTTVPDPALVGVGTFVVFMIILFLVTRLNKDR